MKNIGYPDTKNKQGGGISPLNGIFGAAVGAAKGTTKKQGGKKANGPKKKRDESIKDFSKRLVDSQKSSSDDSVLAYTPLYNTNPDKKKKQEIKTEKRLKKNEEKKKRLEEKFANKKEKKIERQKRLNSNKEVRDLKSQLRAENTLAKWGTKNKRKVYTPVPSKKN